MLSAGESFKLHISILPQPLLDYLTQRNFLYKVVSTAKGEFIIEITAQQSSIQQGEPVTAPTVCNTSAIQL